MIAVEDEKLPPGGAQGPHEGIVSHRRGLLPPEPSCLGTLAGWGGRVAVGCEQEVSQVKVGVPVRVKLFVTVEVAVIVLVGVSRRFAGKSPLWVMPRSALAAIILDVEPPGDAPSSDVEVERPQMLPHPGRQWGGFCVLRHASHVITKYMPAGADAISPVGLRVAPTPRVGSLRRSYRRLSIGATREAWRPPAGHRQPNVGHCEVHDGWDIFRPPLSP